MRFSQLTRSALFFLFCLPAFASELTSVPQEKTDKQIRARIERIFTATGWYPELTVEAKNGIVFLKGAHESSDKKKWAEELLNKTEGVVAVIDQADVKAPSEQVFQPAQEEVQLLLEKTKKNLPYIASSIFLLLLFICLAWISRKLWIRILTSRGYNPLLTQAISNGVSAVVVVVGVYFALRSSGLSGLAFTLLGGTGALGIGLGLALKDSFENYIAGLMISVRGLIKKGEFVEIQGFKGVVQSVTTGGTSLMDLEGNSLMIPNAQVFRAPLKNYTRNPNMRLDFIVGIGYDDSVDEAQRVIVESLESGPCTEFVLPEPKAMVAVDALGAATVNLRVYFWIDAVKFSRIKVKSFVVKTVKESLMKAEISLPDDAREVVFASPLEIVQKEQRTQLGREDLPDQSAHKRRNDPEKSSHASAPETLRGEFSENETNTIQKQADQSKPIETGSDLLQN